MSVRSLSFAAALAATLCCANFSLAQAPPSGQQMQTPQFAPAKPYKKVAATLPPPVNDPELDTLRKQLGEIAQRKERAALAPLVVSKGFFWERESGNGADEKKSGLDNFAAAMGLDLKDGSGWDAFADYAAEPSAHFVGDRKDLACSPTTPEFSDDELLEVVKATQTDPSEWGFPMQDGLEARETAKPDLKVVEKLGMHFVRVMPDVHAGPNDLLRVVTPSGKVAYIPADDLSPIGIDQVCYLKEGETWKIAGYIGEGAPPQ